MKALWTHGTVFQQGSSAFREPGLELCLPQHTYLALISLISFSLAAHFCLRLQFACMSALLCSVPAFCSVFIWAAFKNLPVTEREPGGGDPKVWLYASAVIFFITEPVLTYIMECTGRDSERQRLQSGPLPTLGYANPSTAVWVWESNDQTKHFPSFLSLIYGFSPLISSLDPSSFPVFIQKFCYWHCHMAPMPERWTQL